MEYKQLVSEQDAPQFAAWLKERGGLLVWKSVNLANTGVEWITPATKASGQPMTKPTWQAADHPHIHLTDPAEIGVVTLVETDRFEVALRVSSNGFMVKLTDESTDTLNEKLREAGEGATYQFDYDTQEAVILSPRKTISMRDWLDAQAH